MKDTDEVHSQFADLEHVPTETLTLTYAHKHTRAKYSTRRGVYRSEDQVQSHNDQQNEGQNPKPLSRCSFTTKLFYTSFSRNVTDGHYKHVPIRREFPK